MFTKTLTAAIFVVVIALALVTAGSYASLATAVKTGNSVAASKPSSHNGNKNTDNGGDVQTGIGVSNRDLKKLADCQSNAAGKVGLTQSQVDDCYNQVFPQGPSSQAATTTNIYARTIITAATTTTNIYARTIITAATTTTNIYARTIITAATTTNIYARTIITGATTTNIYARTIITEQQQQPTSMQGPSSQAATTTTNIYARTIITADNNNQHLCKDHHHSRATTTNIYARTIITAATTTNIYARTTGSSNVTRGLSI